MTQDHEVLQMAQLFDFVEEVVVWAKDCQHRYCWVNQAFLLNYEASRPREVQPGDAGQIRGKTVVGRSGPGLRFFRSEPFYT